MRHELQQDAITIIKCMFAYGGHMCIFVYLCKIKVYDN
jgi:hypothetical protein